MSSLRAFCSPAGANAMSVFVFSSATTRSSPLAKAAGRESAGALALDDFFPRVFPSIKVGEPALGPGEVSGTEDALF